MNDALTQAVDTVRKHWSGQARVGLILGTGLGSLSRTIRSAIEIPFSAIPCFPTTTALSHRGRVVCGQLNDVPVMLLDGRCHAYEGYSIADITLPIRVMHACGVEVLMISNASGGLNPQFRTGDLLVIEDHISLMGKPFLPPAAMPVTEEPAGPLRFRHIAHYDRPLIDRTLKLARRQDFPAHRGVYVAVTGPNYETRAEYRFLRTIGGDAVGMSTVPEAWVGSQLGMRILGLSIITNVARFDAPKAVNAHHVVDAAASAEPRIRKLVAALLAAERTTSSTNFS